MFGIIYNPSFNINPVSPPLLFVTSDILGTNPLEETRKDLFYNSPLKLFQEAESKFYAILVFSATWRKLELKLTWPQKW